MSRYITINGASDLIEPAVMEITRSDLYSDSSGRSAESGDMILYSVKGNVYSVELEFVGTAAQIKAVEDTLSIGGFNVTFKDMNETVSKKMYASDRKKQMLGVPSARKYRLSFNLIEMSDADV